MRKSLWIILVLLLFAAMDAPKAHADVVTDYAITFTPPGFGTTPAPALVTYDNTTNLFTSFTLDWDGTSFDLTASANTPTTSPYGVPPCINGNTGPAATIDLLTNCSSNWYVMAEPTAGGNPFSFPGISLYTGEQDAQGLTIGADIFFTPSGLFGIVANGTFSAAVAPEPGTSSLVVIAAGVIGLVMAMRKRNSLGHQQAT